MNNTQQNQTEANRARSHWTDKIVAWWTVFGVLVVAVLVMLSAWT